jgi:hypothetical protein
MSPSPHLTPTPQPSDSDIAQRAYNRWVARGRPVSDGREDWFAAEAELQTERAAATGQRHASPPTRRLRSALRRLGL